jgi:hypothetical protein
MSPATNRREDYPNVKFWFKHKWNDFLNECSADVDIPHGKMKEVNVSMQYVETASGETIDGNWASNIQRFACSIWVLIANKKKIPPATWGCADIKTKEEYYVSMCELFVELSLCDLDWKVEQIAMDNYPSWQATWAKQQEKNSNPTVPDSNGQAKHLCCESMKLSLKKKKVEDVTVVNSVTDDRAMTEGDSQVCLSVGSWAFSC